MERSDASVPARPRFSAQLPTGERIDVTIREGGGHGYEVAADGRAFGGFDTRWTVGEAYDAAVNAARNRRKRS